MARKKASDQLADMATIRRGLNLNQKDFWSRFGVTQSGGSRYESGRNLPNPLRVLITLWLAKEVSDKQLESALKRSAG
jgi:DNA-binding transcriptional regulator YiaG